MPVGENNFVNARSGADSIHLDILRGHNSSVVLHFGVVSLPKVCMKNKVATSRRGVSVGEGVKIEASLRAIFARKSILICEGYINLELHASKAEGGRDIVDIKNYAVIKGKIYGVSGCHTPACHCKCRLGGSCERAGVGVSIEIDVTRVIRRIF